MENGTEFVEKVRLVQKLWPLEGQRSIGLRLGVIQQGGWFLSFFFEIKIKIKL